MRSFRYACGRCIAADLGGALPHTTRLLGRFEYHAIRIEPEDIETATNGTKRPMSHLCAVARHLRITEELPAAIVANGLGFNFMWRWIDQSQPLLVSFFSYQSKHEVRVEVSGTGETMPLL